MRMRKLDEIIVERGSCSCFDRISLFRRDKTSIPLFFVVRVRRGFTDGGLFHVFTISWRAQIASTWILLVVRRLFGTVRRVTERGPRKFAISLAALGGIAGNVSITCLRARSDFKRSNLEEILGRTLRRREGINK